MGKRQDMTAVEDRVSSRSGLVTNHAQFTTPADSPRAVDSIRAEVVREVGPRSWIPQMALAGVSAVLIGGGEAAALAGLASQLTTGQQAAGQQASGQQAADLSSASRILDFASRPVVIISLAAAVLLLNLLMNWVIEHAVAQWSAQRRVDILSAFADADFPDQRRQSAGTLIAVTEQIGSGARVLASDLSLPGTVARAAIYLAAAFLSSWITAAIAGLSGALLMMSLRVIARQTRRLNERVAAHQVDLGEQLDNMVVSSRELQQLARWPQVVDRATRSTRRWMRSQFRARWAAGAVAPLFFSGILCIGLATVIWGAGSASASLATSGMLLIRALGALQTCQLVLQQRNDAVPSLERVVDTIVDLRSKRAKAAIDQDSPAIKSSGTSLEFDRASFGYGQDQVLSDVSVRMDGPGGVAIVGESGAGKSTMLAAAAGLLWATDGEVLAGGRPIRGFSRSDVGSVLGLVAQDTAIIQASVRENLLRSDCDRSDDEILEVLQRLSLRDTVESFDGGLDALLGRASHGFSGGELQRLGLARLMLNRPSIWLLDEPTSALDRENASSVQAIVAEAVADHLVVLVTHRPELLALCDQIILVADGRVVDVGDRPTMIAKHSFVRRMTAGDDTR